MYNPPGAPAADRHGHDRARALREGHLMYIYIYIYVYIEREICVCKYIYIYTCTYI